MARSLASERTASESAVASSGASIWIIAPDLPSWWMYESTRPEPATWNRAARAMLTFSPVRALRSISTSLTVFDGSLTDG